MAVERKPVCCTLWFTTGIDLTFIAIIWSASLIITDPFGDFPLNDDWSYALTVRHLIETRDYLPTGWTSMPLITNVLWGSLFCILTEFSFNALRFSTLTFALSGIIGTYLLMIEAGRPRWLSIIAALTLAFNPIYYALSNTFMTDVPYTALAIFTALFLVRHLRTASDRDLLIGTILAVAATLSRQLAISIPIAFAAALILRSGVTKRSMLRAVIPPAICFGALHVFQQWLVVSDRLPARYHIGSSELLSALADPGMLVPTFGKNAYVGLLYLGLFLMPILIFALLDTLRSHRKKVVASLVITICGLVVVNGIYAYCYGHVPVMPLSGNIMIGSGIGPLTLRDTSILGLNRMPGLPEGFWLAVTVVGLIGAAFLSTVIGVKVSDLATKLKPARMNSDEAVGTFFLLSVTIYLLPLLVGGFFDRYLIPAIPFIAVSTLGATSHFHKGLRPNTTIPRLAAVGTLIGLGLFAVIGTRDYLAWNRVRWEALHDLVEKRSVKVEDIDGGFEFNGFHLYDPEYDMTPEKSWWWVKGDTYLVAFGAVPGYSVMQKYSYHRWMPPHAGSILLLKRNLDDSTETRDTE